MTTILGSLIQHVRKITNAGVADCKIALEKTYGDVEKAVDYLRKAGIANAAKKLGRSTNAGIIALASDGSKAAIIALNCETDFVVKNNRFLEFSSLLAYNVFEDAAHCTLSDFIDRKITVGQVDFTVFEAIAQQIAIIGENIKLDKVIKLFSNENSVLCSYVHGTLHSETNGDCKIAAGKNCAVVELKCDLLAGDQPEVADKIKAVGEMIAMNISGTSPQALRVEGLDPYTVETKRSEIKAELIKNTSPGELDRTLQRAMEKFYEEVVLLKQECIAKPGKKIEEILEDLSQSLSSPVSITMFKRFDIED